MNSTKHRWTEADHELVRAHYGEMPMTELAALIGVTLHSLHHRAKQLGVTAVVRFKGTPLAGLSDAEVAAHVQALQDEGMTLLGISKMYGISRRNLWNVCKAAGATLRNSSDDMRRRWATATPEQQESMVKAAHERCRELWANGEHHAHYAQLAEARRTPEELARRRRRKQEWAAGWRQANRMHLREWKREYRRREPAKHRAWEAKKNEQRAAAEGTFTEADVKLKLKQQQGRCHWCGKKLGADYHVDHVIALARGGTHWPSNICCACPDCNLSKSAKMPWEFAGRLF